MMTIITDHEARALEQLGEWIDRHHSDERVARARLLAAFQALKFPPGFFKIRHKDARRIILNMTGIELIARRVPSAEGFGDVKKDGPLICYLRWAGQTRKKPRATVVVH